MKNYIKLICVFALCTALLFCGCVVKPKQEETYYTPQQQAALEALDQIASGNYDRDSVQQDGTVQEVNLHESPYYASVCVFSAQSGMLLREESLVTDQADLGENEYFSFCLMVNDMSLISGKDVTATMEDGSVMQFENPVQTSMKGEKTQPACFALTEDQMADYRSLGSHAVTWSVGGEVLCQTEYQVVKSVDFASEFTMPTQSQIDAYNAISAARSPYIAAWFSVGDVRYTQYAVDFKADHLPSGTYCSLGNWKMDHSALETQYASVTTDYNGVHAYAGFQNTTGGAMKAIMSFWDVYCKDSAGNVVATIHADPYPLVGTEQSIAQDYHGEGSGFQCLVPFSWEQDHWYRMLLKCVTDEKTGNTLVQQWVCDLETGQWTQLSYYDTNLQDTAFRGNIAVFLENYLIEYAGDVRSMQVCNARYMKEGSDTWTPITRAHVASQGGLPKYEGSYTFGTCENGLWFVTSGVGGDYYNNGGQQGQWLDF
ncbi:MAG: DUF3472 domain-containing protein [Clostridia bacterium]|nr:DUF3472 domain-containing protein [Clostridia bacterium]